LRTEKARIAIQSLIIKLQKAIV